MILFKTTGLPFDVATFCPLAYTFFPCRNIKDLGFSGSLRPVFPRLPLEVLQIPNSPIEVTAQSGPEGTSPAPPKPREPEWLAGPFLSPRTDFPCQLSALQFTVI